VIEHNEMVDKYVSVLCCNSQDYVEWWNETREEPYNELIYISDPSNHTGILINKLLQEKYDLKWNKYIYNGFTFKSKQYNLIEFEGYYFSGAYLNDILNNFFKDRISFDISMISYDEGCAILIFKIDEEFSIGICNRMEEVEVKNDGSLTYKSDEGDETKKLESQFVNGIAVFDDIYYGKSRKIVIYKKEKLFTLDVEEGDSLCI